MMKNIKLILKTVLFVLGLSVNAQIASNNSINATINSESAFLDVSSSASTTNFAKGLGFPQTNLTTFSFVSVAGSFIKFKTGYDGLLVYNIATGTTPATGAGVGGQAVTPGFYYFSNPTPTPLRSSASGEWIALGGGGGGGGAVTIVEDTPVPSALTTASGDVEQIIRLTGTANGTSTHINLGTTTLAANTVKQFRKAVIYDSTDKLVLESTGDYDSLTNVFVTGNGMTNVLLPAGNYSVELYYTAN